MKLCKNKNQLLIVLLAVGFFVGILYENIISKNNGITISLFQTGFLEQYKQTEIIPEEYLWYVARIRLTPMLLLFVLSCIKWKKILVSVSLLWTGFLAGVTIVSAVIQLGIKGILFCVAGAFPHMIFYGMTYGIVFAYLYDYPRRQWNGTKTIFMVLLVFLGIVLETYLTPILIKMII